MKGEWTHKWNENAILYRNTSTNRQSGSEQQINIHHANERDALGEFIRAHGECLINLSLRGTKMVLQLWVHDSVGLCEWSHCSKLHHKTHFNFDLLSLKDNFSNLPLKVRCCLNSLINFFAGFFCYLVVDTNVTFY